MLDFQTDPIALAHAGLDAFAELMARPAHLGPSAALVDTRAAGVFGLEDAPPRSALADGVYTLDQLRDSARAGTLPEAWRNALADWKRDAIRHGIATATVDCVDVTVKSTGTRRVLLIPCPICSLVTCSLTRTIEIDAA